MFYQHPWLRKPASHSIIGRNENVSNFKVDAILFHLWDLSSSDFPKQKSTSKPWVLFNLESPSRFNETKFKPVSHLFDWTLMYNKDSSVFVPYGVMIKKQIKGENNFHWKLNIDRMKDKKTLIKVNNYSSRIKEKQVAWFVSNCHTPSNREEYVKQLSKFIEVDIYGACGKLKCSKKQTHECKQM
ncbi:alpha-(1:3)-fucosyltransferase 9-like protein, partial [Leptotrombidium deliense]